MRIFPNSAILFYVHIIQHSFSFSTYFFLCLYFVYVCVFLSPHTMEVCCMYFMNVRIYLLCTMYIHLHSYCCSELFIFSVIHLLLQLFLKNFFLEFLKEKKNIWTNFIREVSIGNSDINIILAQGLSIIAKTRPVSLFWNLQKKMIIGTYLAYRTRHSWETHESNHVSFKFNKFNGLELSVL